MCILTCNRQLYAIANYMQDIISSHVESSRSLLTDLLYGLLTYDPAKRITAREALDHPFFRIPT
jgi:dual-specificity kinase